MWMVHRLKVCLNGCRGADLGVPVSPAQLAVSARESVAAGAEAVHLHPRDAAGAESLVAADIGAAVAAVRTACPGTPVGVSTGLWITGGDPARRHRLVSGWAALPASARPDFASVNVGESGYAELAAVLRDTGIGVEAGVWSVADAEALTGGPLLRVLVEVMEPPAVGTADRILAALDARRVPGPRLLHGEGTACWPLVAHAGRLGLPTRIGLEDTLTGPAGEAVAGNADLVRLALDIWQGGGRPDR
jgi:uncharacterized protein (DUF849 family)